MDPHGQIMANSSRVKIFFGQIIHRLVGQDKNEEGQSKPQAYP
jgi:hypothetical protein